MISVHVLNHQPHNFKNLLKKNLWSYLSSSDSPVKGHICPLQVRVHSGKAQRQLCLGVKGQGALHLKKKKDQFCLIAFEVTSSIITSGVKWGHGCWAHALHRFSRDPCTDEGLRWSKAFRVREVVGSTPGRVRPKNIKNRSQWLPALHSASRLGL